MNCPLRINPAGKVVVRRMNSFGSLSIHVDWITLPDRGRAKLFVEDTGLKMFPALVYNCPRRFETLPKNDMPQILKAHGHPETTKTVYFLGWLGGKGVVWKPLWNR